MNPKRPKLLVVDDETDICTSIQKYFGRRNFVVSTTGSGREALSIIRTSKPHLVLLDLKLNDIGGLEMLQELRQFDQKTKVVIITGSYYPDAEIERLTQAYHLDGFKDKPLILENIEALVYKILGMPPVHPDSYVLEAQKSKTNKDTVHDISTLLVHIKGRSESFLLDYEEGFYQKKTPQELLQMTMEILRQNAAAADKIAGVLKKKER